MNCDVVNGGYDQQSYLVFPPQHEASIRSEFNDYRRRVFPFTQREERFRESIGPPPSIIHVDTKVMANLSFIDKLCTSTASWKEPDSQDEQSTVAAVSRADSSLSTESPVNNECKGNNDSFYSTASNPSSNEVYKEKMPPTPLESLQTQYGNSSTAQTITLTVSADSRQSSRLSTSSARFMELEARIARQQKDFARKDAVNTDKHNNIERKLARLDEVEGKIDNLRSDLDGQILSIMERQANFGDSIDSLGAKITRLLKVIDDKENRPATPIRVEDREKFQSPVKKKQCAVGEIDTHGGARIQIESTHEMMIDTLLDTPQSEENEIIVCHSPVLYTQSHRGNDVISDTSTEDENRNTELNDVSTDLESHYKDTLSHDQHEET